MNAFRLVMSILSFLLSAYILVIVARIYLSWIALATSRPPWFMRIERALEKITDPWLNLFRGMLRIGAMDFSPVPAILVLSLLSYITSTLARGGTPTAMGVLILVIGALWSFVRFIAGVVIILLVVRIITLYAVKGSHPFLDGLDRYMFPRVARVMGLFTSKKVSYPWALAVSAVILAVLLFAANWLLMLLIGFLRGL